MAEHSIARNMLVFLVSISIILNMIFFFPTLPSRLGFKSSLFFIFGFILVSLSIIVSFQYPHARKFFLIFWNPILAGIIASFALYLLVSTGFKPNLSSSLLILLILYSTFVIYYTHKSALEHPGYELSETQSLLSLEENTIKSSNR